MKRISLVLLLITGFTINTIACVNNVTELKDGTVITDDNIYYHIPYGHNFLKGKFPLALKRMDSLWKATNDIGYFSDYGLILILQGKYEEAKNVYIEIEKLKPGRYETASNLGTIYELSGDNKNALKWIRKAIKIYPASHMDSEWLHVKILEAKIKGDTCITSDFLLNTNFGEDTIPANTMSQSKLLGLKNALFFQLNERVTFVKPKDKIVAQLLFDMGNVQWLLAGVTPDIAITLYEQAKLYGYIGPLLDIRLNYLKCIQEKNKVKADKNSIVQTAAHETSYILLYILGVGVSILSIGIVLFFFRKKK